MSLNQYLMIGMGAILLGVLVIGVFTWGTYNSLVSADLDAKNAWAHVQTTYQRRADLIPNLVETVKGARDFEADVQTEIAAMRSQAGAIKQKVKDANTPEEIDAANAEMTTVFDRLMVVVEAYPDLKATANFADLQAEITGTENRVKYERDEYNNAVRDYEMRVRAFPSNIIAGMFGFEADKWSMFEAKEGAENAPEVDFGD